MNSTDLFQYIIVFVSGLVHGLLGLGFPMVATPLLALLSDVRSAVVTLLLPTLGLNIVNIIRGGHWRESIGRFWPLALFGVLGSFLGTQLLVFTNPEPYKLVMAAMILVYLNNHRLGFKMQWVRRHTLFASAVFGTIGGLLAGTVNVMVPALIIFALELELSPLVTVQLFNFCFMLGKVTQGVVLTSHGLLSWGDAVRAIPIVAVSLAALALGIRYRDRIDAGVYRRWLKRILAFIAILLILQYFEII